MKWYVYALTFADGFVLKRQIRAVTHAEATRHARLIRDERSRADGMKCSLGPVRLNHCTDAAGPLGEHPTRRPAVGEARA